MLRRSICSRVQRREYAHAWARVKVFTYFNSVTLTMIILKVLASITVNLSSGWTVKLSSGWSVSSPTRSVTCWTELWEMHKLYYITICIITCDMYHLLLCRLLTCRASFRQLIRRSSSRSRGNLLSGTARGRNTGLSHSSPAMETNKVIHLFLNCCLSDVKNKLYARPIYRVLRVFVRIEAFVYFCL